jgi:hypothetical protein
VIKKESVQKKSKQVVMQLEKVVPFGRSLDEYQRMFNLSPASLNQSILGAGDGPASFNAEMAALGKSVVSVDPLYVFRAEEIEKQFYSVVDNIIAQIQMTPGDWVWSYHQSPEHLKENRIKTLKTFIRDYEQGKAAGRYLVGELPRFDFQEDQFELALCSHFLFLYSDHFTYEFHRASILEMLRVAPEVRLFPLLTLDLKKSPYVEPLIAEFQSAGYSVSVEKVGYELQRGGNEMLRIQKTTQWSLR